MLSSFNLTQHVSFPTHKLGHTLDLVITSSDSSLHPTITSFPLSASDHFPLFIKLNVSPQPKPPPELHTFSRFHSINIDDFISDLNSSRLVTNSPNSLGSLLIAYDFTLHNLLDKHAPLVSKFFPSGTHSSPWFTPALRKFRSIRRSAENLWKRTRCPTALATLKTLTYRYHKLVSSAKKLYFSNLILGS